MANIHMSYGELESQASQLEAGRNDMQERLRVLRSQVDGLISSGFVTDQASGAFGESYHQFTTGADLTIESLTSIAQFLRTTAAKMSELDSQLAAAARI